TEQIIEFFGKGAFGTTARANKVSSYDVMWVSDEIWANLAKPYVVNGVISGNVLQAVLPFAPVKEIRPTFAFSGNEFIAYVRRRDVISPLVGMAVGVVPLPRPLPNVNYNFQIMSAEGLQITADDQGLSGVIYGANLA
ncbi:major capsid protein, partial [Enterobacter kobei]